MAGFENDVMLAKNMNFDEAAAKPHLGVINAAGKLPIGTGNTFPTPEILGGSLTSPNGTISIGYSSPNITLDTTGINDLHTARYIVASSTSGTGANYTTIASAIAAAVASGVNSTVFIQPGTFTEDLILSPGIDLVAFNGDQSTPNVTIIGKCTFTSAGTVSITGIRLQTNSDFLLAVTGSAASSVNLNNCYLNCSNHTGISFTTSSGSSGISINNCAGNIGTTGISIFSSSSSGGINIINSNFGNSGLSTTASTISAGSIGLFYSTFQNSFTSSSTAGIGIYHSLFQNTLINSVCLTIGGSGSNTIEHCNLLSGTASALSISSTAGLHCCTVSSSNTNAIAGAGTINYTDIVFTGTSKTIQGTLTLATNAWAPYSQAIASTDATKVGTCAFDSSKFTVDSSGFVSTSGTGVAQTITGQSGGALAPTAGNWNIIGGTSSAGTSPVVTSGSGSTLTTNVQTTQAIGAADATKIGLAAFNSSHFSVDSNGFVSASGTGILNTLTGNSGGAISPTSGNINTLGTGSITIAGSGSTLTTQLTGLTNHNVQVGAGTATLTQVAPSATSGVPLVSNGASADPSFSTALIAGGGTASTSFNINGAVYSNTTTTGALQSATLTSGQLLIGGTTTPAAANLTAGSGISITNGNNSITIAGTGGGFTWTDVTGATQTLAAQNGYITDRSGGVTYTLPASGALGDIIKIVGKSGLAVITPNANQTILIGSTTGVTGVTGTATATNAGDCIELVCITAGASSSWRADSVVGTWSVVTS